jgi:uncharacterized protein (DUF924 family)
MSYFSKGIEYENNNNKEEAIYYYNLAVLFGESLGLKKLEYLTKDGIQYIKKYHNSELNLDFVNLLHYWFDFKFTGKVNYFYQEMPNNAIHQKWLSTWFAKNSEQIKIDNDLKQFEEFYEKYKNYDPTYLYEYVAMIILYDQLPRNIYRNTPKAYETDHIAFKYANMLTNYIDYLPFHISIFVILSHCHQENPNVHMNCKELMNKLKLKYMSSNNVIINTLNNLFNNHYDRVSLFGRIPERNNILGRKSTDNEIAYMKSL